MPRHVRQPRLHARQDRRHGTRHCCRFSVPVETQLEGDYKQTIEHGLRFLVRRWKCTATWAACASQADKCTATGWATIVLCEAYGMTHDRSCNSPREAAVRFIVAAQDERGGGWRCMSAAAWRHARRRLAAHGA